MRGVQNVHTLLPVTIFEWDPAKAEANWLKHGIEFATEAIGVFDDPMLLFMADDESDRADPRFCRDRDEPEARVLVVVHAYPTGEVIRIISARKETKQEERDYHGI